MKGTYDCHGRLGVLVRDPDWVIRYEGREFGGFGAVYSGYLTWVFMAVESIPFDQVPRELVGRHPAMIVAMDSQRVWVQHDGDWKVVKAEPNAQLERDSRVETSPHLESTPSHRSQSVTPD